jgi:putative CocE/NonD family hydrolase
MQLSRRSMLLATAGALAAVSAPDGLAAVGATAAWKLPEKRPFKVIDNDWIPMKDGVRLAARFWIPEGAEQQPVPVVWEYLPYRLWDGMRLRDERTAANLAPYGIAFVRVDIRGTGNSEGVMVDEYDVPELTDAVQVIAWLAKRPWSNGSVGMRGLSWGGINSLQVAAMAPPELKAIMPMGCCDIRYTDDAHYTGGALAYQNMTWGSSFKGHMAGPPDPAIAGRGWETMWRQRLEATPAIEEVWTRHQTYDSYWKRGSIAVDYAAIQCPVYICDGWGDPYSNVIGRVLANLKVPRKGLLGPWGHVFPNDGEPIGLAWEYEEVRWWQHWLGGVETGLMDEPMLRVYMMEESDAKAFPNGIKGHWVAEETWPSPRIVHQPLYLASDGALAAQKPSDGHVTYVGDKIVGLTKPQWIYGRPTELEQSADDANSLVFDSKPLEADFEILGYPTAKFRVSADVPIAHLGVRLTEVTPDGKSWLVTYNLLNLTHRDGHEHPTPLVPGTFYDVELPLYMMAYRFKAGNRIRVAVSESLWPLVWPSPATATLDIALGVSRLELPVRLVPEVEASFAVPELHKGPSAPSHTVLVRPDANGLVSLDRFGPPSTTILDEIGTTVSHDNSTICEVTEGKPNSSRWKLDHQTAWKRGDWDCTIQFGAELTGTAEEFHLNEWMVARKGDTEIFRREKPSTIKRELL